MSFFVTSIAYYPENKKYNRPYKHTCTFGHFSTVERAQTAVADNYGGMDECLYNYLVIEEVAYGIYGRVALLDTDDPSKGEWWYQWEHPKGEEGHWVTMTKPNWSYGIFGWAMA